MNVNVESRKTSDNNVLQVSFLSYYILKTVSTSEALTVATRLIRELPERSEDLMSAVDVFKEEGRREMLIEMLRIIKSIVLSDEVKEQLSGADLETLKCVSDNFLEIESEEDLREMLS